MRGYQVYFQYFSLHCHYSLTFVQRHTPLILYFNFRVNLEENHYFLNSTIKYDGGIPKPSRELCIIIFGSLVAATALASFIRSLIYYCACMKASLNLHDQMFKSVTRATINFFNETSAGNNSVIFFFFITKTRDLTLNKNILLKIGSILTRFSKDFGIIDEQLPSALHDFLQVSFINSLLVLKLTIELLF